MRYVAAYLLATLGGQTKPSAADIEKILSSVGIESEADKVKTVIKELGGKNLEEMIAEGQKKLATVPSGGGAAPAAAGAPVAAAAADSTKAEPAKKEEPESESDDDMGFGLFD